MRSQTIKHRKTLPAIVNGWRTGVPMSSNAENAGTTLRYATIKVTLRSSTSHMKAKRITTGFHVHDQEPGDYAIGENGKGITIILPCGHFSTILKANGNIRI
jgi:hypothetical protein